MTGAVSDCGLAAVGEMGAAGARRRGARRATPRANERTRAGAGGTRTAPTPHCHCPLDCVLVLSALCAMELCRSFAKAAAKTGAAPILWDFGQLLTQPAATTHGAARADPPRRGRCRCRPSLPPRLSTPPSPWTMEQERGGSERIVAPRRFMYARSGCGRRHRSQHHLLPSRQPTHMQTRRREREEEPHRTAYSRRHTCGPEHCFS